MLTPPSYQNPPSNLRGWQTRASQESVVRRKKRYKLDAGIDPNTEPKPQRIGDQLGLPALYQIYDRLLNLCLHCLLKLAKPGYKVRLAFLNWWLESPRHGNISLVTY